MVITPPFWPIVDVSLKKRRPSEFATPDHKRIIQQTALLQILHQPGRWLIGIFALGVKFCRDAPVLIPARMHQLNKTHTALRQSPSHQAVVCERPWFFHLRSVQRQRGLRLVAEVGQFRNTGLHLVGHFILGDTRGNFRIAVIGKLQFIESGDIVQPVATHPARHPIGVLQI